MMTFKKILETLAIIFLVPLGSLIFYYFTYNYLDYHISRVSNAIAKMFGEGYRVSGILIPVDIYEGTCYKYADYKLMVGYNLGYYIRDNKGILGKCIGKNITLKISYDSIGRCYNGIVDADIYEVVSLETACYNIK